MAGTLNGLVSSCWSDGEEGFDPDTRVKVLLRDAGESVFVVVFVEAMSRVSALRG